MNNAIIERLQHQVCNKFNVQFSLPEVNSKLGIALNVRDGIIPLNGLRHPVNEDMNGWYIWAGEHLSQEDNFFKPLHIEHINEWCPSIEKFLALPPGWRFLIADDYEDVWFDESLLKI